MEKTVEQAWKDNAFNLGHSTDYVRGISDYKQALRQAIEKEMNYLSNSSLDIDRGARSGYKIILQLLDTVKPL